MIFAFFENTWFLLVEMSQYLLLGMLFVALLNLFFNKDLIVNHIGGNDIKSIIKSSLFGVPLPLCSCGVIPTSVYLSKNGASKPAVIAFLISTPQTGIDSIIATYGMLGPVFAIFRPIAALIMGIVGGITFLFFNKKEQINDSPQQETQFEFQEIKTNEPFFEKAKKSIKYAFGDFINDISTQFLIGLIVAGLIATIIPNNFFSETIFQNEFLSILLIIAFAIPMYVCATASIPIAVTLMMKGLSPGVAYAFLVAGPVSNAASIAILSKILKKKSLILYLSIVVILTIIFSYLLNWIHLIFNINPHTFMVHNHIHSQSFSLWQYLLALIFIALLSISYYNKIYFKIKDIIKKGVPEMEKFKVEGMSCSHCVMNVEKAIRSVEGVEDVKVSLSENSAEIKGNYNLNKIKEAVDSIGYKFIINN
jgi:uncharacterized membrane protein YraQ (UPF0718 family)/copper chaperone CopZ